QEREPDVREDVPGLFVNRDPLESRISRNCDPRTRDVSMPVPSLPQVHPMRLGLWAVHFGACADPELQVRAAGAAGASGFEAVGAEFRALGVAVKERGAITDEYLQAIRVLWTEEVPRFAGRFAAFDGIRFEPKPRQRPHPPIAIGGRSPRALRRAARFASGWYGPAPRPTAPRRPAARAGGGAARAAAGRGRATS